MCGKIAKDQGIFMTNHGKKGMDHGNFADHYGKSFDPGLYVFLKKTNKKLQASPEVTCVMYVGGA